MPAHIESYKVHLLSKAGAKIILFRNVKQA